MSHSLIIGSTESGKTSLAKKFAKILMSQNKTVLVCDILGSEWNCDYMLSDPYELLYIAKNNKQCHIFLDESGDYLRVGDKELHWFATRSRHQGHSCYFISQRANMLAPTVRNQTTRLFMFTTSSSDSKLMADEYNDSMLYEGNRLKKLEYYYAGRYKKAEKLILTF